ncbi:hypothetical protein CYMTET_21060 [Cymbomonas tetramitiformis]|uniref:Uncharacterized protein n=1 Tax=Cymbomonas tetramitiformis TaxID=36881 RepID=A0AAE0G440_9CHLO|nr:hypothetical protein CYMTET_21060 [Cymbomonas tetramitiformis]
MVRVISVPAALHIDLSNPIAAPLLTLCDARCTATAVFFPLHPKCSPKSCTLPAGSLLRLKCGMMMSEWRDGAMSFFLPLEAKRTIPRHSQREESLPAPTMTRRYEKTRTLTEQNLGTHRKQSLTSVPATVDEAAILNRILDEEPSPVFETHRDTLMPEESMMSSLSEHVNLDARLLPDSVSPPIDPPDGHDDERNVDSPDP